LDGDSLLGELLDKVLVRTELLDDLLRKDRFSSGILTSTLTDGGEVLPVDGVIDVSSKVELDCLAEGSDAVVVEVGLGL
jgi:hypothetical protein